jgi:subtilisin family serine protease
MVSALEKVIASDVIVVLAAGNDARSPAPPADRALAKQLLVVAATDTNGRPAEFSSRGPDVVWAPGVHFPVSVDDEHWEFFSGTTFSTAAIAALAAQVVAATGESGPKVVAAIQKAAKDGGGDAPTPTLEGSIKAMKP